MIAVPTATQNIPFVGVRGKYGKLKSKSEVMSRLCVLQSLLIVVVLMIAQKGGCTMSTRVISQCEAYSLMLRSYPDIMNINQICEVLCISTKTGYKLLRDGEILSLKVGRTYRIPKAHLLSYLKIGTLSFEPS